MKLVKTLWVAAAATIACCAVMVASLALGQDGGPVGSLPLSGAPSWIQDLVGKFVGPLVGPAIAGAAVWAIRKLGQYLDGKTSDARLKTLIDRVDNSLATAVVHVEQTVRPLEGDVLKPEGQKKLFDAAMNASLQEIGPFKDELKDGLGLAEDEFMQWITRRIEAKVHELGPSQTSAKVT